MDGIWLAFGQRRYDLVDGVVGDLAHFVVGAVLDRMVDENAGGLEAESVCLDTSRPDKFVGGDHDAGDAAGFEIGEVVHTARRARPSVGEGFDHRVAAGGDLLAQIGRGGSREGWFSQAFNVGTAFTQMFG